MTIKGTFEGIEYEEGSGNVFADLGLPNPEELMAKALLSITIERAIREKALTPSAAADLMQCTEAELSRLTGGEFSDFCMERLFRFLNALGMDVRIDVAPRAGVAAEGRMLVNAA